MLNTTILNIIGSEVLSNYLNFYRVLRFFLPLMNLPGQPPDGVQVLARIEEIGGLARIIP